MFLFSFLHLLTSFHGKKYRATLFLILENFIQFRKEWIIIKFHVTISFIAMNMFIFKVVFKTNDTKYNTFNNNQAKLNAQKYKLLSLYI